MTPILQQLEDLLDREREALVTGRLEALPHLRAEKESLVDRLEEDATLRVGLGGLADKTRHNQALLGAALKGTRAAARRMDQLREVQDQLTTYTASGERQRSTAGGRALEKKA